MSRWTDASRRRGSRAHTLLACAFILALLTGAAPVAAQYDPAETDDALEAYLTRLGLRELLADHLLARIEASPREARAPLAERLSKVYVELLGEATSAEARAQWEERSRNLLTLVPDVDSLELRLGLARAVYQPVEATVERARLRLASPQETAQAEATLRDLAARFDDVASKAHRKVEILEGIQESGDDSAPIIRELADARRLRSLAFYHAGWSKYYLAYLSRSPGTAGEALKSFGWLLNAPGGQPASLERLPTGLLKYDHVARSAIACALCASIRGHDIEADAWLDAVEQAPDLSPEVRAQLLPRRISIYAAAKRWADLERVIRLTRRSDRDGNGPNVRPLGVATARLLAVSTLDADRTHAGSMIERLARIAMADLVAQHEVAQVLDLVERYGPASLGESGFVPHYVRALKSYEDARAAHRASGQNPDEPAADADVIAAYRAAAALFARALDEADAASYTGLRLHAARLDAFSHFYAGLFEEAAARFESATALTNDADEKSELIWQALIAVDRAIVAQSTQPLVQRRAELAAVYLQSNPDSDRAAALLIRGVDGSQLGPAQAVEVLLGVARESPLYPAARRHASRLLYQLFRGASRQEREFAAIRFAGVAEEVQEIDRRAAADLDEALSRAAIDRVITRGRQLLDALLSVSVPDADRAAAALTMLRGVAVSNDVDIAAFDTELLFREAQISLARGDDAAAAGIVERLNATPGPFANAANRLMYNRSLTRWVKDRRSMDAAKALVQYGRRVIDTTDSSTAAFADEQILSLYSAVAEAAADVWRTERDEAMRDLAIRLDQRAIAAHPRLEPALRRLAELSEAAGDLATALDAWRTLLSATPVSAPEWFEARYETIRLLMKTDTARAREALDQHKVLHPEFGPSPWGERLRELDAAIAPAPARPAPSSPPGGP